MDPPTSQDVKNGHPLLSGNQEIPQEGLISVGPQTSRSLPLRVPHPLSIPSHLDWDIRPESRRPMSPLSSPSIQRALSPLGSPSQQHQQPTSARSPRSPNQLVRVKSLPSISPVSKGPFSTSALAQALILRDETIACHHQSKTDLFPAPIPMESGASSSNASSSISFSSCTPNYTVDPGTFQDTPRARKRQKSEHSVDSNASSSTADAARKVCQMGTRRCATCETAQAEMGLHGHQETLDSIQEVVFQCDTCHPRSPTKGWSKVFCQACKRSLGVSCLKVVEWSRGLTSVKRGIDFYQFAECTSCHEKYRVCTDCGGGGNKRTGKYRPKELFANGRRNCLLSHTRIGTLPILDFDVWTHRNPSKFIELEDDIKLLHEDFILTTNALSEIMEASQFQTMELIKEYCISTYETLKARMTSKSEDPHVQQYMVVAFANASRKSLRMPQTPSFVFELTQVSKRCPNGKNRSGMLGYATAEWNWASGDLDINAFALRSLNSSSTLAGDLLQFLVTKVHEDFLTFEHINLLDDISPTLSKVCLKADKHQKRFVTSLARFGFIPNDKLDPQFSYLTVQVDKLLSSLQDRMTPEDLSFLRQFGVDSYLHWKRSQE